MRVWIHMIFFCFAVCGGECHNHQNEISVEQHAWAVQSVLLLCVHLGDVALDPTYLSLRVGSFSSLSVCLCVCVFVVVAACGAGLYRSMSYLGGLKKGKFR